MQVRVLDARVVVETQDLGRRFRVVAVAGHRGGVFEVRSLVWVVGLASEPGGQFVRHVRRVVPRDTFDGEQRRVEVWVPADGRGRDLGVARDVPEPHDCAVAGLVGVDVPDRPGADLLDLLEELEQPLSAVEQVAALHVVGRRLVRGVGHGSPCAAPAPSLNVS